MKSKIEPQITISNQILSINLFDCFGNAHVIISNSFMKHQNNYISKRWPSFDRKNKGMLNRKPSVAQTPVPCIQDTQTGHKKQIIRPVCIFWIKELIGKTKER